MSTINRTDIARRQLKTLRDSDQRIQAMLLGGLAEEFTGLLPELISEGRCTLSLEGGCFNAFHTPEPRGRHIVLSIQNIRDPETPHKVCFDGLVKARSDDMLMAKLLASLIASVQESENRTVTEADAIAVRRYFPVWGNKGEVEFAALQHHLSHDTMLPSNEFLFPDFENPHRERRAADRYLHDFVSYLKSLGVGRSRIECVALILLNDYPESFQTLHKICAVVGLVSNPHSHQELQRLITKMTPTILRMHFATEDAVVRTQQLDFLMRFSDTFKDEDTFIKSNEVHQVFVEVLARGKIQTLLQFLNEVAPTGATDDKRSMNKNTQRISGMIAEAFRRAMLQERYGIAAALGQLNPALIAECNRDRAVELALLHRQPIALEWAHHLVV